MATLHIKGQVCQYVYTGTANWASIPFVGIAVPLNLHGIMQQTVRTALASSIFTKMPHSKLWLSTTQSF